MDRTVFAVCACTLIGLAVSAGCGRRAAEPSQDTAPLVLAELQAASPGPWRQGVPQPLATTSLERSSEAALAPPDWLDRERVEELQSRRNPLPIPLEQDGSGASRRDGDDAALRFAVPEGGATPPNLQSPPVEPAPSVEQGAQHGVEARRAIEPLPTIVRPQFPNIQDAAPHDGSTWASPAPASPSLPYLQQAEEHVSQGFRLADRNALYLARAEWIAALELVAEVRDTHAGEAVHSAALSAGLTALEEARDFTRKRPVGKPLDVARVIGGHKTPILKGVAGERLSPMLAAERYRAYAQSQLAAAVAGQPSGSRALFGMAKATLAIGHSSHAPSLESRGQAMALYEAALTVDSRNYRAAHELGVLAANGGDLVRARDLLVHSAILHPHPSTHRNLATVYAKLGESLLSEQATQQAIVLEKAGHRRGGSAVQWVDPVTFASTAPASDSVLPPVAQGAVLPPSTERPATAGDPAVSTAKRGIADWLPWTRR